MKLKFDWLILWSGRARFQRCSFIDVIAGISGGTWQGFSLIIINAVASKRGRNQFVITNKKQLHGCIVKMGTSFVLPHISTYIYK